MHCVEIFLVCLPNVSGFLRVRAPEGFEEIILFIIPISLAFWIGFFLDSFWIGFFLDWIGLDYGRICLQLFAIVFIC